MMLEQRFELGFRAIRIGTEAQTENDNSIEATLRLIDIQRYAKTHAIFNSPIEVGHPLHIVGHNDIPIFVVPDLFFLRRRRIRTNGQQRRNCVAHLHNRSSSSNKPDEDEALWQNVYSRCS